RPPPCAGGEEASPRSFRSRGLGARTGPRSGSPAGGGFQPGERVARVVGGRARKTTFERGAVRLDGVRAVAANLTAEADPKPGVRGSARAGDGEQSILRAPDGHCRVRQAPHHLTTRDTGP